MSLLKTFSHTKSSVFEDRTICVFKILIPEARIFHCVVMKKNLEWNFHIKSFKPTESSETSETTDRSFGAIFSLLPLLTSIHKCDCWTPTLCFMNSQPPDMQVCTSRFEAKAHLHTNTGALINTGIHNSLFLKYKMGNLSWEAKTCRRSLKYRQWHLWKAFDFCLMHKWEKKRRSGSVYCFFFFIMLKQESEFNVRNNFCCH